MALAAGLEATMIALGVLLHSVLFRQDLLGVSGFLHTVWISAHQADPSCAPLMKVRKQELWHASFFSTACFDATVCIFSVASANNPDSASKGHLLPHAFMYILIARWLMSAVGGRCDTRFRDAQCIILTIIDSSSVFLCPLGPGSGEMLVRCAAVIWIHMLPTSIAVLSPCSTVCCCAAGACQLIMVFLVDWGGGMMITVAAAASCIGLSFASSVASRWVMLSVHAGIKQRVDLASCGAEVVAFRTVLRASCDAVIEVDEGLRIRKHEQQFADMLHWGPDENLQGVVFTKLTLSKREGDALECDMLMSNDGAPAPAASSRCRLRRSDGAIVFVELFHAPITMPRKVRLIAIRKDHGKTSCSGAVMRSEVSDAGRAVDGQRTDAVNELAARADFAAKAARAALLSTNNRASKMGSVDQSSSSSGSEGSIRSLSHPSAQQVMHSLGSQAVFDGKLRVKLYERSEGAVVPDGESITDWMVHSEFNTNFLLEHIRRCSEVLKSARADNLPADDTRDCECKWILRPYKGSDPLVVSVARVSLSFGLRSQARPHASTADTSSAPAPGSSAETELTLSDVEVTAVIKGVRLAYRAAKRRKNPPGSARTGSCQAPLPSVIGLAQQGSVSSTTLEPWQL